MFNQLFINFAAWCMLMSIFFEPLYSKTLEGQFQWGPFLQTSDHPYWGQYLGSFTFTGKAPVILFDITYPNVTADAKVLLFLQKDWEGIGHVTSCQEQVELARLSKELHLIQGNLTDSLIALDKPTTIHLVYLDRFSCPDTDVIERDESVDVGQQKGKALAYRIQLLNPDTLGNPTDHFSAEESGLLRFFQLLTLTYFILGCIFGPRLYDTLTKVGPMNFVIQLLTGASLLQVSGAVFSMLYLRGYSVDGISQPSLQWFAEFLDTLSHIIMLYLLMSLSYGTGATSTGKVGYLSSFRQLRQKSAAKIIAVVAVIQAILFLWEEETSDKYHHYHRSAISVIIMLIWVGMAGFFGSKLYLALKTERSALKREFYKSFTKTCLLWFLGFPVLVLFSWLLPAYLRYKFVTIMVEICQSTAVILLYQLFMSRSLFWEISALGSVLPLKIDRKNTMSIKIHS